MWPLQDRKAKCRKYSNSPVTILRGRLLTTARWSHLSSHFLVAQTARNWCHFYYYWSIFLALQPDRLFRISLGNRTMRFACNLYSRPVRDDCPKLAFAEQALPVAMAFRPAVRAPWRACSQVTIAQNCLVPRLMGCAAGWGRIFTTGLTYNVACVADTLNLLYWIGMSQTVLTHRLLLLNSIKM